MTTNLEMVPNPKRQACKFLEWRNTAPTPEDMPEMAAYCKSLRQYLPDKLQKREGGICGRCVLYNSAK